MPASAGAARARGALFVRNYFIPATVVVVVIVGVLVELVRGDVLLALISAVSVAGLALAGWSWLSERSSLRASATALRRSAALASTASALELAVERNSVELEALRLRLEAVESDLTAVRERADDAPQLLP